MLVAFVMLFVFNCVLSLTPADLAQAKAQNIYFLSSLRPGRASPGGATGKV